MDQIYECLRPCYRIGYCGLFDHSSHRSLYIQTATKNARMMPSKLVKLLAPFGAVGMPATFRHRNGVLLAERGKFRTRGGLLKRMVTLAESGLYDNLESDVKEQKTQETYKCEELSEQIDGDPLFVPVYSGFNRKWKIVSWNLYKKDFKRQSSKPFREFVLNRQDHKCNYCRCEINFGEYSNADMDHEIGLHAGGQNVLHNVQALCVPCHRKKTALESRRVSITMSAIMGSAVFPGANEPLCQ